MNPIVTIDGPSGAGKSTISRILAKQYGFVYLDTGAMYRAVALQSKREGIELDDAKALQEMCTGLDLKFISSKEDMPKIYLGDEDISSLIRTPEMDMLASGISAVQEVREAMTEMQRKMGQNGGVVAEGRDIGTVVFPNADYKFFITASTAVRAERRYKERTERGESVAFHDVETELIQRDDQDQSRAIAPLQPAEDAQIIDTTDMDIKQVVEKIRTIIK